MHHLRSLSEIAKIVGSYKFSDHTVCHIGFVRTVSKIPTALKTTTKNPLGLVQSNPLTKGYWDTTVELCHNIILHHITANIRDTEHNHWDVKVDKRIFSQLERPPQGMLISLGA